MAKQPKTDMPVEHVGGGSFRRDPATGQTTRIEDATRERDDAFIPMSEPAAGDDQPTTIEEN